MNNFSCHVIYRIFHSTFVPLVFKQKVRYFHWVSFFISLFSQWPYTAIINFLLWHINWLCSTVAFWFPVKKKMEKKIIYENKNSYLIALKKKKIIAIKWIFLPLLISFVWRPFHFVHLNELRMTTLLHCMQNVQIFQKSTQYLRLRSFVFFFLNHPKVHAMISFVRIAHA